MAATEWFWRNSLQVYGWKDRKNSSRWFLDVLVSYVPDCKRLCLGSRVRGSPPSS